MSMVIYILIAILMFGVLIAVHEFGHFITAKLLGFRVNEFAIGMGPKLLHRQRGETEYTLRALPIGGFCAMEGEDGDSGDPRAFNNRPVWRQFIVLVAGSFMTFLTGLLIFVVLFSQTGAYYTTEIAGFLDGFPLQGEEGLMVGDRIVSVDGHAIYLSSDLDLFFNRAGDTMDLVIERDGERIVLDDFPMAAREYVVDGETQVKRGIIRGINENPTLLDKLALSWYNTIDTVRLVWVGLGDLVTGAVGLRDMSGAIGIVTLIGDEAAQAQEQAAATGGNPIAAAAQSIAYIVGFIAINLAVMNLLPIPALDGGRILFLIVGSIYRLFAKKRLNPKYEGYVNAAGFVCLMALMLVVAFSDVLKLFGR